ncbi:MAG: glycoside hydrolase family 3 N-terminal domain-containing protein [Phototrophicaceae bacterium]
MQLEKTLYQEPSQSIENRVQNLLDQMTLAEKIGQMTQVEKNSIKPEDVMTYFIGSILSGGGGNPTPNTFENWRKMVQAYMQASLETRLSIPMIYGSDAVHGHSNVKGAVIFPHNVGLGATRDANLVERIAHATAIELLATNVHWDFAPAVSVPQDIRWGRSYEGFSEDTHLVTELGLAYARGLQKRTESGEWVLPSVKHFAADGGTEWDSRKDIPNYAPSNWQAASQNWRIDQGDARMDEETLRAIHLAPYKEAVDAGVDNIMVSFSSWNGLKMHAHEYLLTTVLKGEWGFEGFLVSDWMAIDQLKESFYDAVVTSINAGVDMVMVPFDYKTFINIMENAVSKGDITIERVDDAVSRILRTKFKLGLFETPMTSDSYLTQAGSEEHRALAREAVQKSAVLLKNDSVLPISKTSNIVVAGAAADSIGLACGGWTIEWQGGTGAITDGSTLLEGLNSLAEDSVQFSSDGMFDGEAEIGIVVIAEEPYAEGEGDREDLTITAEQTQLIEAMRERCAKLVLLIYSGRPIIITHVVDHCDAIIAAWLPGTEANAIADVLLGDVPFTGKLPFTWIKSMDQLPLAHLKASDEQPLWQFGFGL